MPAHREEQGLRTGRTQVTVGTRLIACSVLVALAQLMLWVGEGQWSPFNIAEILRWIGTERVTVGAGAGPIVDWLLAIPISAGIAAIGFVVAWLGASKLVAAAKS